MDASVGNKGFSVLPRDAFVCGPEKSIDSNHRISDWQTAALPAATATPTRISYVYG